MASTTQTYKVQMIRADGAKWTMTLQASSERMAAKLAETLKRGYTAHLVTIA